jgi:catalase
MIEGFGVHSFRLLNEAGESTFVKFHWRPKLGIQSTVWDEALKLQSADNDFHRRDLFEAIQRGDFPNGSWRCSCSPKKTPTHSRSTTWTRPRSFPNRWCRCR